MQSDDLCFNFPSMMHPSLRRVIVLLPALVWGCAHETSEMPDELGAEVTGGGSGGTDSDGEGGTKLTGGTSSSGSASMAGTGGSPTKPSTGGGGSGGASMETGGVAGSASGGKGGAAAGGSTSGGSGGATTMGGAGGKGGAGGMAGTSTTGGLGGTAGTGGGGTTAGAGGTGGGVCDGVAAWSVKTYDPGDRVKKDGKLYECKPFPFKDWCANPAYEPGLSGGPWSDAWTLVGGC